MIRFALAGVVLSSVFVFSYTQFYNAQSFAKDDVYRYEKTISDIPTLELAVSAWGIFDTTTGEIISGAHTESTLPIASLTKLFTAYATMANGALEQPVSITASDIDTLGRAGKLRLGDTVTMRELLFPLLIESSNDAATALNRALENRRERFVDTIITSQTLESTTIVDSTGLGVHNVSSVRDLARFYVHLKATYPHIHDITQLRMYITDKTGLINSNPARSFSSFTGGKHGFTDEAGNTFVGTFTYGAHAPDIGIVILGSADLRRDIEAVLAYNEKRMQ